MNEKIIKFIRSDGYCCLWSFFEAHRETYTSILFHQMYNDGCNCTLRALQYQRAAYRHGESKCENRKNCLKARIREARKSP